MMSQWNLFRYTRLKSEDPRDRLIPNLIRDIVSQIEPGRIESNTKLLKSLLDSLASGGLIDDKTYVPERFIQILATLPEGSKAGEIGAGILLKNLWDNLQHPPLSYTGDPYKYRTADGSNNNVLFPHIGRSGSYYARSVTPRHIPTSLPDPGMLFDTLLARRGNPRPHPTKVSSLLFALATIIIHDIFRTDDRDPNIVAVTSYLDLSPLYGADQVAQNSVRTFANGKLKPDTFAEVRMLGQPPECSALLITFNRFHNHVVDQLALINEGQRFSMPANTIPNDNPIYEEAMAKRDNDLFQTARLITCSLYMHIIVNDYFRTIINMHRTDSKWNLNPSKDYEEVFGHDGIEKGIGNQVSVEFNLIYRWHSTISVRNERWLNDFFKDIFPGKDPEELTQTEFKVGMNAWVMQLPKDPGQRVFGDLKRREDGHFEDADLVRILTEAAEDHSAAFGPRHVPVALRAVEILSIRQSRSWGVGTLNELRMQFGMIPHKTFEDINSDPAIASSLQALYGDVDNVELYPGVVVEEPKVPMIPGSGLCAGFTTTRAILSDAVTLVRGDRFYTVDYSSVSLTAFGIKETANDLEIAGGGVIYKLLMRAFPRWYPKNSIYAFYPFTIPSEMRLIEETLGHTVAYDWSRPCLASKPIVVATWKGAKEVLLDTSAFRVPWDTPLKRLSPYGVMLGSDGIESSRQRAFIGRALYRPETTIEDIRTFFENMTMELLNARALRLRGLWELDCIRDVASLSWSRFTSQFFHIPLKNETNPVAVFDDRHLFENLQTLFQFVFLDIENADSLKLHKAAVKALEELEGVVKPFCEDLKKSRLKNTLNCLPPLGKGINLLPHHGMKFLDRLKESGKCADEISWWVITLAFGTCAQGSQALGQILDLFLQESYSHHWPVIQALSMNPSPAAFEQLRRYVLEALRLCTPVGNIARIATVDGSVIDGNKMYPIKRGGTILVNVAKTSRDSQKFLAPDEIRLDRPDEGYMHFGYGMHSCLGSHLVPIALTAQLRVFAQLKNLRRAPGPQGRLRSTTIDGLTLFLTEGNDKWSPFPNSMKVHFDPSETRASQHGLGVN